MKYVALFRGINVGGKNIVKMADLEQMLCHLGLYGAKTYIQSGNAVFESAMKEKDLLRNISAAFSKRFGFEVDVMIRSADEMRDLIERLPITAAELTEAEVAGPPVEHLYVYFLKEPPGQALMDAIGQGDFEKDILRTGKREIYLLCREGIRKSKLAARLSAAAVSATARNWRTVQKLYEKMGVSADVFPFSR